MGIFVSAVAQTDNVGDVVIRRELVDWLRSSGRTVHVLTARMPPSYVDALDLAPGESCDSQRAWLEAFFRQCLRGRAVVCFPPGQQPMVPSRAAYLRALLHIVMAVCARIRGGAALKVARSLEGESRGLFFLERCLMRACDSYTLRDLRSPDLLGAPARTVPDLGAGAPALATRPALQPADRSRLAMSWRSDRPLPMLVVQAVRAHAEQHGLELVLVTQVRRDGEAHERLAQELGCRHLDWPEGVSHSEQELRVAEEYAACRAVISNRLHGLVLGWNEGALPLGYSAPGDRKIWNHLGRLGLDALLIRGDHAPENLGDLLASDEVSVDARRRCHTELAALRAEVVDLVRTQR